MQEDQLKGQVEAAYDRIVEAFLLMQSVSNMTAHPKAQDIAVLLVKVDQKMSAYRGSLYQHGIIQSAERG